jgi:hypothetical protein
MSGKPEVTRLLARSLPVNGRRYELWRTPEVKPGYHLYGFQNEIEISRKPCASELRGRIEFERRVEAHSA